MASDECYVEFNWDEAGELVRGATALAGRGGRRAGRPLAVEAVEHGRLPVRVPGRRRRPRRLRRLGADPRRDDGARPDPGRRGGRLGRRRPRRRAARAVRRAAELRPRPAGRRRAWSTPAARRRSTSGPAPPTPPRTGGRSPPGSPRPGTLVAAGDLYGDGGADHVRIALVQPLERLELAFDRIAAPDRLDCFTRRLPTVSFEDLAGEITAAWHARNEPDGLTPDIAKRVEEAIDLLDRGEVRVAEVVDGAGRRPRLAEAGHPPLLPAAGPRDHRARPVRVPRPDPAQARTTPPPRCGSFRERRPGGGRTSRPA